MQGVALDRHPMPCANYLIVKTAGGGKSDNRLEALTFSGRLAEAWPVWETKKELPGRQFWMAHAYVMSAQHTEVERLVVALRKRLSLP